MPVVKQSVPLRMPQSTCSGSVDVPVAHENCGDDGSAGPLIFDAPQNADASASGGADGMSWQATIPVKHATSNISIKKRVRICPSAEMPPNCRRGKGAWIT